MAIEYSSQSWLPLSLHALSYTVVLLSFLWFPLLCVFGFLNNAHLTRVRQPLVGVARSLLRARSRARARALAYRDHTSNLLHAPQIASKVRVAAQ